jgi:lon-related putative ATP-dependent protease
MAPNEPLSAADLAWRCPEEALAFSGTEELESLEGVIGQERVLEALDLALAVRKDGYNVYALGPDGIGKHTLLRRRLEAQAATEPAPSDWVHVSSFSEPRKPRIIGLEAGRGAKLQAEMAQLVGDLRDILRNAFENEEYRTRRQVIEEELKERQEQAVAEVEAEARAQGIALLRTPMGLAFAPTRDGRIIPPEQFQELPDETRKAIEQSVGVLQKRLSEALGHAPAWMKETREKLKQLNDDTARFAVDFLIEQLKRAWADVEAVQDYLEELRWDVIEHVPLFLQTPEPGQPVPPDEVHPLFRRYRVNLLVDNAGATSAPVVHEDDPTFDRLIGKIEYRAEMGALLTDFLMIRGGALHRANGGYLILDARKVLTRPLAWEALKRALRTREIRIESPLQTLGLLSTVTLEPEPAPLRVKVVLLGEREIYFLLARLDPDFPRLFKIAADFDERVPRTAESLLPYARLIATIVRREELRHIDRGGVARAIEHVVRRAEHREKMSLDLEDLGDLLREADYQAARAGRERIGREHVEAAGDARIRRLDRAPRQLQEMIREGTVQVATSGEAVGQINGLSVFFLAGTGFGRPSRITARVRMGGGQVLDIERETKLGGPIHTKGVLILGGFLGARYSAELPLALHATLVFEQSYGGVDGDSASAAELVALLSAIAAIPLRQSLAMTGSVDQHGEVQAIGGVDEKIEGFFDLCAERGLDGSHAVLIPRANVRHLMLHRRVVEAVEKGLFAVHAIDHVDQAIEHFTGMPAGERGADGKFPAGSVNRRVEDRLRQLAEIRRDFGKAGNNKGGNGGTSPTAGEEDRGIDDRRGP